MHLLSYAILAFWILAFSRTIVNLLLASRLEARMPLRIPRVSVIVPARNEERMIEKAVRAMLAQTYPDLEILVVNDRSTDATGAILAQLAGEDARVVVIDNSDPPPGWLGKPWALHQGSLRATGELLLFIDADILYTPEAIAAAVAELEERGAPMLTLIPRFEMRGFWEHVVMPNLIVFVFTLVPLWLVNRTRLPILAVGGGTGNLVRRSDYDACGGHEALRSAVVDDVGLARLFRRNGRRTEVVMADRMVSVRMYHGLGEILHGFTKNGFAIVGRSYTIAFVTVVLTAIVHLLPYVLALCGNPIAIIAVALITLTRLILFLWLGYRADSALFAHPLMIAVWIYILLRSTWMTGIRREIEWRGRRYDATGTD